MVNYCKIFVGTGIIFQNFLSDIQEFHTALITDNAETLKNIFLNIAPNQTFVKQFSANVFDMAILCEANGKKML